MSPSTSNPRSSKPSLVGAGLSEEARRAMNAAFDALSEWRNELTGVTERNASTVFDKMASAAKALGWPSEFVDMTRQQMTQASRMQLQMLDQVMDIWEQQMKSPGSNISLPDMTKLAPLPFGGSMPGWAGFGSQMPGFDMQGMAGNPMQFWLQAADMWQKSWQQAFAAWMEMQQQAAERASRGRGR
jgi:hypothetical protein